MIKVRFNLGAGENHQKWKVTWADRTHVYLDPNRVSLIMRGCTLKNRHQSALKIFNGHSKFVCAWIECDDLQIVDPVPVNGPQLKYNPRVKPNWMLADSIVDGARFDELVTNERNIFVQ